MLYSQAGDESELRTFRLVALSELILNAGYSSLYIDIGNSIQWGALDPFSQLLKLDPDGEAFFSPDEFKPGTTEPAWTAELTEVGKRTNNAEDGGESDEVEEHPCCSIKILPWSNALMFIRPTPGALRLVRLMKQRSISTEHGGGGRCSNHEAHNLALFEGCGEHKGWSVRCQTLDPYLFPSEAHIVNDAFQVASLHEL